MHKMVFYCPKESIYYISFADFVFSGQHTRTVNRVRFHENDAHLLLSGSQDGSMHIFVSINQQAVSKQIQSNLVISN